MIMQCLTKLRCKLLLLVVVANSRGVESDLLHICRYLYIRHSVLRYLRLWRVAAVGSSATVWTGSRSGIKCQSSG